MKLCDYGCGREAEYPPRKGMKGWCCEDHWSKCPGIKIKRLKTINNVIYYNNSDKLCDYGCGQEAQFQFKNGKWCCSKHTNQCPAQSKKHSIQIIESWKNPDSGLNSTSCKEKQSKRMIKLNKDPNSKYNSISCNKKRSKKMKEIWKDPNSKYYSISCKKKQSDKRIEAWENQDSIYNSILYRNKFKELHKDPNSIYNSISYRNKLKISIKQIQERYPFFSKIEEMRYNPNKLEEREIQVHCKNHNCKNSKEKGGWFTPTGGQLIQRYTALEKEKGNDGGYFYCSQHCKDTCLLYGLRNDPYKIQNNNKPHTPAELKTFNKLVLKRDNEICYYCTEHHATIVHHLKPQKLEPFFALDPDYAISVCTKCHHKYCHPAGSEHSTGNLAKIVCSVESQKFLNQKIEDI